jgi:site-specific DNA recombinase
MTAYFAYTRVSTPRQGERGVSLPEQKDAIERFARQHGLEITRWFEERESASHQGRPAFTEMMRLLRMKAAQGVIIHKIDRSARNLEDWVKLVDAGVEIHFAAENLDLRTVAGRLSADIQAVVAAHYSRNLREEVKKGLYGRLKQGFFPFRAPIGYLDQGSAMPKVFDPMIAPLIRVAFDLYNSGQYSLPLLAREMYGRGLRNIGGTQVTINGLATILRNPFYIGVMRIVKNGESFPGKHEPLVTAEVFKSVQALLDGKRVDRVNHNAFTFSRILGCGTCSYSLIGERQKGHVYYRCHNRPFKIPPTCPITSVRQEELDEAVIECLTGVNLSEEEAVLAHTLLGKKRNELEHGHAAVIKALKLQLEHLEKRLAKLTDLLVDGTVEKSLFTEKQTVLLLERAKVQEELTDAGKGSFKALEALEKTVELAKSPSNLYKSASPEKRRELVKTLLSNITVSQKKIDVTLSTPFHLIAGRQKTDDGRAAGN